MAMISIIQAASRDAYPMLLAGIERQYGREGQGAIAGECLQVEQANLLWPSRRDERWLGAYESGSEGGEELERIAIVGQLNGVWFVAICVVDGAAHWMQQLQLLRDARDADEAFVQLA